MFKLNSRYLLLSMLMLVLMLAACGGESGEQEEDTNGDAPETVTLMANSAFPDTNYITEYMNEYSEKVSEYSNGKVEIDVQANGALGFSGDELLRAVRDNLVPISDYQANGVSGDEPRFNLASLPFLIRDFEEAKLFNEIARPYYDEITQNDWNQKILYVNPWPASGFWTQKEITKMEEYEDIKMRTFDENGSHIVQLIGGTPHQIPFSELYSALSTGVVDSVMTSSPTAVDASLWEVLDYYIPVSVTMGVGFVTINLDEYNDLDEESQQALEKASEEMNEVIWDRVDQVDKEMVEIVTDNGIEILEPSEEMMDGLADRTEEVREEFLQDAPEEAQSIVDEFLEAVGRK